MHRDYTDLYCHLQNCILTVRIKSDRQSDSQTNKWKPVKSLIKCIQIDATLAVMLRRKSRQVSEKKSRRLKSLHALTAAIVAASKRNSQRWVGFILLINKCQEAPVVMNAISRSMITLALSVRIRCKKDQMLQRSIAVTRQVLIEVTA